MVWNQLGYDFCFVIVENKNCFFLQLENYYFGSGLYFRRVSKWFIYLLFCVVFQLSLFQFLVIIIYLKYLCNKVKIGFG